jgi:hypothetical protein
VGGVQSIICVQEVKSLKRVLKYIVWVGVLVVTYYLYQQKLGAIPFFLLSIYFFIVAKKGLSKRSEQDVDETKQPSRRKIQGSRK